MKCLLLLCFSGLACGLACSGAAAQAGRFVQDRIAIGFWVPPPGEETTLSRYREIADANFTVVLGGFGADAAKQIDLCERVGLRAVVHASGPVEKWPDGESCWGYMLVDEPATDAFPELAKRADEVRQKRPGRFGYINLLPNYAPAGMLGPGGYDGHVAAFIKQVQPEVLSMDHYPLMRPEGDSRESYLQNLATMRKYSLAARVPFWNFFYSMPFNDRLDPTEAQMRWQIYSTLAYGGKGILYFCYWTPGKGAGGAGEFPKGGAIITAEGRRTRHWDEARRMNAEVKAMGPVLMQLTSTAVVRLKPDTDPTAALAGTPLKSVRPVPGDPPADYLVGAFKHKDGRRAVLINNYSYMFTAWPTVEFDSDPADVREVDKATGKLVPAVDDSPEMKGFQVSLGAGDGRLFVLP